MANIFDASTEFQSRFYATFSKNEGNLFVSPLSIHILLCMAYEGADGETAKQFADVLQVHNKDVAAKEYNNILQLINNIEQVTLYMANKVYIKKGYPLNKEFVDVITKSFLSEVEQIDFKATAQAVETINKWVENKTHSKIQNLILPNMLDASTTLLLLNAIYFKGNWKIPFNRDFTQEKPFHVTSTDTVECQMMRLAGNFNFASNSELDAKILELEYNNEAVSMIIILPNNIDGMATLESKVKNVNVPALVQSLNKSKVEVGIPKFKIETSMKLNNALIEMGLKAPFSEEDSDLSKISSNTESLYISDVIQKAFIEVNEEGSEAAAAGGILIKRPKSTNHNIVVHKFLADHPFMFHIVYKQLCDNAIAVIFSGRVNTCG